MARYTCTEDGASKFWEITVDGASFTVTYGKIGTAGQSKTKTLASAAATAAEAAKLVREKTGKGYVLAGEGGESPPAAAPEAGGAQAAAVIPTADAAPAPADEPADAESAATTKKAAAKKPAAKKTAEPAIPPFGTIEEKALRRLALKLAKDPKIDHYKVSKIVRDANGDDHGSVTSVLWHLIEHGLLQPEGLRGVLYEIDEKADGGRPETIFEMFARMGPHLESLSADWTQFSPGVPAYTDRLLVNAWYRDRDLFERRKAELDPRLQLALAFVRSRFELDIDPAEAEKLLDHLARELARGQLTGNHGLWMSKGGESVEHRLNGAEALIEVATRLGTRDEFLRRTVAHALQVKEPGVHHLDVALKQASLGDVAEIFARCFSWGDCPRCERELAFLESRDDSPESLFAVAEELVPGKTRGQYDDPERTASHRLRVRDGLLALGAVRFAAANKPVPTRFEELYTFEGVSDVYYPTIPRHLAAFAALPRERALAMADKLLAQDYAFSPAALVLAAHRDAPRLRRLLEKDRPSVYVGARYLGLHGVEILPLLEAEMPHLKKDTQGRRHPAMLFALATAASQGNAVDPEWARLLRWDSNGPDPLKYWSTSSDGALRDDALEAFPAELRRATLLRAATTEAHPTRILTSRHALADDEPLVTAVTDEIVRREGAGSNYDQLRAAYANLGSTFVDALCDAVGRLGTDAAFLDLLRGPLSHLDHQRVLASVSGKTESIRDLFVRKAAAAAGDKTRVYTLDPDGEDGFTASPGSFSRLGGSVPGLAQSDYPRHTGEPMTPLLTFDLDEIPELASRYPGARLLVLFHPDPEGGDDHEEARLVPIPRTAVTAPGDGQAMAITALDLPAALFEDEAGGGEDEGEDKDEDADRSDARGPELEALRRQLRKRGGHVFGGPFWIQETESGSAGFLFQLNDGLCSLNLGDVGSLYAYSGGEFVFQCH